MKKEVKVQITLSDGYRERFTRACIKVAKRRVESGEKQAPTESRLQKPGRRIYEKGKKMEADLSNLPPKSSKNKDILNRINSISL